MQGDAVAAAQNECGVECSRTLLQHVHAVLLVDDALPDSRGHHAGGTLEACLLVRKQCIGGMCEARCKHTYSRFLTGFHQREEHRHLLRHAFKACLSALHHAVGILRHHGGEFGKA